MQKDNHNLWKEYEATRDKKLKERLIATYIPLVKHIIHRLNLNLPSYLDHEDLIGYGVFGLIQAIDRYDSKRNVKFETFAYSRIRGSIIDELRKTDVIPQSVRSKTKELQRAHDFLEQNLGRSITDDDICQHLKISCAELQAIYKQVIVFDNIIPLEDATLEDFSKYARPDMQAEISDLKNTLAQAIELLPEQEKLIVTLYYYEGLNFKEIAKVMSLSQGRISQLHSKAVLRLRGRLGRKKVDL